MRWSRRYLDEGKDVTLLKAQLALAALAALGGPGHDTALSMLQSLTGS